MKCFMIIIKDNETSEYYAQYCKPSWESIGISVDRFDAITPKTLKFRRELRFAKYSRANKYIKYGIQADITESEKACWYSHFSLWKESCYLDEPLLILEHDAYLENPENIILSTENDIVFFDKAAMGSYLINPNFARLLVEISIDKIIDSGPYAFISENFFRTHKVIHHLHKKFRSASNQVMSRKYGNTVEHYSDLHKDKFPGLKAHKFIEIP